MRSVRPNDEMLKRVQHDEPLASPQFITAKPPRPEYPPDRYATVETLQMRSAERGVRNERQGTHTPYPLFLAGIPGLDSRLRPEGPRAGGNDDKERC